MRDLLIRSAAGPAQQSAVMRVHVWHLCCMQTRLQAQAAGSSGGGSRPVLQPGRLLE